MNPQYQWVYNYMRSMGTGSPVRIAWLSELLLPGVASGFLGRCEAHALCAGRKAESEKFRRARYLLAIGDMPSPW